MFKLSYKELQTYVTATSQVSVNTPEEGEDVKAVENAGDQTDKVHQISEELERLQKKLSDITADLEIHELKEETFTIPKKLDLITRESRTLQELYTKVTGMTGEACKCNELMRRNFYDFTYHSLRAVHNDLNGRIADLQSVEANMKEEEKAKLENLLLCKRGREKQIEQLEKLWIRLFSPVCKFGKIKTVNNTITI